VHACPEKKFVCVKIADPGDQLLVQQDRFHGAAVFSNNGLELREANVERVGAKAACLQKFIHILDQLDLAEFPLIVECQPAVIHETKNYSRSFRRHFVMVEVLKRAGHAEVQSQPELITCAHKQMFAVSVTAFEAAPFQSPS
jgi:hypothetical protein